VGVWWLAAEPLRRPWLVHSTVVLLAVWRRRMDSGSTPLAAKGLPSRVSSVVTPVNCTPALPGVLLRASWLKSSCSE